MGDPTDLPGWTGAFDTAVRRLHDDISGAGSASPHDLDIIMRSLPRYFPQRRLINERADPEAIVGQAIERFTFAVRQGGVHRTTAPGYLVRVLQNLARDVVRELRREEASGDIRPDPDDDAVARLLDAQADAQRVRTAMRLAVADGQHDLVRIVRCWLNLAEHLGRPPTLREVAGRAAVSHTTVRSALVHFRAYFPGGTRTS